MSLLPFSLRIVGPAGVEFSIDTNGYRSFYNDRAKFATAEEAEDFLDVHAPSWRSRGFYVVDVVNENGE